jgi:hypothetical protein
VRARRRTGQAAGEVQVADEEIGDGVDRFKVLTR